MNMISMLRKQHGLSQKDLGKQVGAAQNTVSNWENGSREPDQATLKKLTQIFNCSSDYLLGITDRKKIEKAATLSGSGSSNMELSEREAAIIRKLRPLSEDQQDKILGILEEFDKPNR